MGAQGAGHFTVPGSDSGKCFSCSDASHTTQCTSWGTLSAGDVNFIICADVPSATADLSQLQSPFCDCRSGKSLSKPGVPSCLQPLTARLTLSELEAYLTQLFEMVRGDQSGIFSDPAPCFISQEDESNLSAEERERLAQLLADSLDVLESEDTLELLVAVCRQGLAHLLDRVADHYFVSHSSLTYNNKNNNNNKSSNSTGSDSDSGFVSPASVALPLARLLPILTAIMEEDGGIPWLNHLQESPSLQRQAANVYETFSFSPTCSNEGWTSTLYQAVSSFWTSTSSP